MIKFQHVSKSFFVKGEVAVIQDISFVAPKGKVLCIVGPSGCGKSTIINLLAGFLLPDSGKVLVRGKAVTGPSPRRTVVFQDFALFQWKTVFDNVAFGLTCAGIAKEEVAKRVGVILQKMQLERFASFYPRQLSGGMKQRVALGRALAVEPEILLMDEPFASLDEQTRDRVQEELVAVQSERSQTMVFVTHNIEEALFLGDTILVLSAFPTRVMATVSVSFPRPRKGDIKNSSQFIELKREVQHLLRS